MAAAALVASPLTACATSTSLPIEPRIQSGKALRIWTASAEDKGSYVIVAGLVRRPLGSFGIVGGHLHIVAQFGDGRPDVVVDTRWGSLSTRSSRTARFSAKLPIPDASAVSSITVSYAATHDRANAPSEGNP